MRLAAKWQGPSDFYSLPSASRPRMAARSCATSAKGTPVFISITLLPVNAEPVIVDRKTGTPRTIYVRHAAVCVTGGIQPGILLRALGPEHRESGLAAQGRQCRSAFSDHAARERGCPRTLSLSRGRRSGATRIRWNSDAQRPFADTAKTSLAVDWRSPSRTSSASFAGATSRAIARWTRPATPRSCSESRTNDAA